MPSEVLCRESDTLERGSEWFPHCHNAFRLLRSFSTERRWGFLVPDAAELLYGYDIDKYFSFLFTKY